MFSPYKHIDRDEPADCRICGAPLAGDNDTGVCWHCHRQLRCPTCEDGLVKGATDPNTRQVTWIMCPDCKGSGNQ